MTNSFQQKIYAMPTEAVVYPGGTSTAPGPPATYLEGMLVAKSLDPTDPAAQAATREWLNQALAPLVGPDAILRLQFSEAFLVEVIRYRISLLPK